MATHEVAGTSPRSARVDDLADLRLPYLNRLALRPWESPHATMRLRVPNLLFASHCPVQTNWIAITGATSAGKTTLVRALEKLGYPVVHEIARGYVESEMRKGRTVKEIRSDDHNYRLHVFGLTQETELGLLARAHEVIYFDRCTIDCLSFHRASGYDPHEILFRFEPYRFRSVLHCNMLPFEDDGLRTANEDRRYFLDAAIERDYRAMGYVPARVPFASVEQRVQMAIRGCTEASWAQSLS